MQISRKRRSPIWRVEKEVLQQVINESNSYQIVLQHFGLGNNGGNYATLKERIQEEGLDLSVMEGKRSTLYSENMADLKKKKILPLDKILVENSTYTNRNALKKRLLKEGLLKPTCYCCGTEPFWNGKPLTLQLEHKNGVSNDHRLENLELLCPNCHSQTATYCGKNKRKEVNCGGCQKVLYRQNKSGYCKTCLPIYSKKNQVIESPLHNESRKCNECSEPITRRSKTEMCLRCYSKKNRKTARPVKTELVSLLLHSSFVSIGKQYNVSDNAVRKWCKYENLPYTKKEIDSQREQLEEMLRG